MDRVCFSLNFRAKVHFPSCRLCISRIWCRIPLAGLIRLSDFRKRLCAVQCYTYKDANVIVVKKRCPRYGNGQSHVRLDKVFACQPSHIGRLGEVASKHIMRPRSYGKGGTHVSPHGVGYSSCVVRLKLRSGVCR